MSEKKGLIVEAAMDVFSRLPFHQVKMEEVAERAGVGKGTIYEYFSGKDELFFAVVEAGSRMYLAEVITGLDAVGGAAAQLQTFFSRHLAFIDKHAGAARLLASERRIPHPDLTETMLSSRRLLLDLIASLIKKGMAEGEFRPVDTQLAAHVVLGTMTALWVSVLLGERSAGDIEATSAKILDLLGSGLTRGTDLT